MGLPTRLRLVEDETDVVLGVGESCKAEATGLLRAEGCRPCRSRLLADVSFRQLGEGDAMLTLLGAKLDALPLA